VPLSPFYGGKFFVGVINFINGRADGSIRLNIIWYCNETNTYWFPGSRSGIWI